MGRRCLRLDFNGRGEVGCRSDVEEAMSVVTNIILTGFNGCEPMFDNRIVECLQKFLGSQHGHPRLVEVSEHATTGGKAMETFVWVAACNYLNVDSFIECYRDAMRTHRGRGSKPQLFIRRDQENQFQEIPHTDPICTWKPKEDWF